MNGASALSICKIKNLFVDILVVTSTPPLRGGTLHRFTILRHER
jgi:hypothetical protein